MTAPHYPVQQLKIIRHAALAPGPRLIVLGAVHGNETCGSQAIERICAEIDAGAWPLRRGSVTFVPVSNPLAYQLRQRAGERNLNRNLRVSAEPADYEDRIGNVLCPLLQAHDVLLDLHSFHTAGEPFVMIGPENNHGVLEPFIHAHKEEALALRLGVRRLVDGWLDTYARGVEQRRRHGPAQGRDAAVLNLDASYGIGTTEYMRQHGGCALTLECGQHDDPQGPAVAYRAIVNTLAHLGLIDAPPPAAEALPEALRLHQVIDREHVQDHFARPWASFDRLTAGERIGTRHDGSPVLAPEDGYILFPNPNAQPGQEWFYLAKATRRFA